MTSPAEPLVEMATKRLRHELEEEFRSLPLEERLARVLLLATPEGKSEAELWVRTRAYAPHAGAPLVIGYIVSTGQVAAPLSETLGEAVVQLGATLLSDLETQAAKLREVVDGIERRMRALRAGARSVGPVVEEDVPF